MPCCICSHDVRLFDGILQAFFPFYLPLSLYSSASLNLFFSSSQPASLRYYCIKKTNRVAAKFRYKAKDVGQPPRQGVGGWRGGGEKVGQGAVLNACQMRTKDPFFYGRTITRRSSRAHKNNAGSVARGGGGGLSEERGSGKWGKCLRY